MKRRFLKYARRMLGVSTRQFARREDGSVMVMTIVFALPLAMFLFVSYNAGVTLTYRMRAQCVADASAYTGALWQARFLNYCAYSRRQVLSNYSTMALCTAYESSLQMYYNIYDAQNLIITFKKDRGMVKIVMTPSYYIFKGMQLFEEKENRNPVKRLRKAADAMNPMLSRSQLAMFLTVGVDTTPIMEKVVEEAERDVQASTGSDEFSLQGQSFGSLLLGVEREEITVDQVEFYLDYFTQGRAPSPLPLLGRPMFGGDAVYCGKPTPYIQFVMTVPDGVDISDSCDKMEAKERVYGYYVIVVFCIYGIPVPVGLPIIGETVEVEYEVDNPFSDVPVYKLKENFFSGSPEPSLLAIVEVDGAKVPYYPHMGLHPKDLVPGGSDRTIRAFSRAKVYFKGFDEDLEGGQYQKPNLSYPFWGAKLAPIRDNTVTGAIVSSFLRSGQKLSYY